MLGRSRGDAWGVRAAPSDLSAGPRHILKDSSLKCENSRRYETSNKCGTVHNAGGGVEVQATTAATPPTPRPPPSLWRHQVCGCT
eukprot:scaffold75895_cov74-Phaeocystis_antarctica.AAC.1